MPQQLIDAPADDTVRTYQTLGYVEAYDAKLNLDYAYVAYKETERESGAWRVYIRGSQTAGAVFEPEAMRLKSREIGSRGETSFPWGYSFDPADDDARMIQFRMHVEGIRPKEIEMIVRLRKFDGSPDAARSVRFAWPA